MTTRTVTRLVGVVVAATLTLTACGGTSAAPAPTTTAPDFAVDTSTPVGALNDRILRWINAEEAPDPAEVDAVTGPELA
ncbi:MAG: hypothetical protein WBF80_17280, partial [Rhodococcus sp. (in: high G+C Gram-positive bacteria)]